MRAIALILLTVLGCARDDHKPTPPTLAGRPMMDPVPTGMEVALLAGGCFWGMEELLRAQPGVLDSQVGYTGGTVKNATYGDVKGGDSGHAEAVRLTFDPAVISYEQLLAYLFRIHDPTTKNRQGNDVGTQYRSAIFYHSPGQQAAAERAIARETTGTRWTKPITTQVVPAGEWYDAEGYHQDYLQKTPGGYTCHWERE